MAKSIPSNIEQHPLMPFLPENGRVLMLGSFPPPVKRWCIDFFYPNFINDMWRIFGEIFMADAQHFVNKEEKSYRKEAIIRLLQTVGVGIYDTATAVVREKDNASDKYLQVVTPTDIDALLLRMPMCHSIITTGEKATETICARYGITPPKMGETAKLTDSLTLYRLPSSSRAYPMNLQKKAEYYRKAFCQILGLSPTALQIAAKAYAEQTTDDGQPLIQHVLNVTLMSHTDEERCTALLLNVLKDGGLTIDDLLSEGIPQGVANALQLLTPLPSEQLNDYIQRIINSKNPIALQVKYNELRLLAAKEEKYNQALEMVKAAIEGCSKIELYRKNQDINIAVFAGGCFWGVQHEMEKIPGVLQTLVGYTGGEEERPCYADVRDHLTHHVEAVLVEYDSTKVSYPDLCKVFFEIHDPAQTDGVGEDIGPQYRSCIFYADASQKEKASAVMTLLRDKGYEVNTLLLPLQEFWIGEEYHQLYYAKTGGEPYCHMRVKKF